MCVLLRSNRSLQLLGVKDHAWVWVELLVACAFMDAVVARHFDIRPGQGNV